MDITTATELISTVGFPIVCVMALAYFAFYMVNRMSEQNEKNMEKVQARCQDREEKLYQEIKENREVNAKAIETIAQYAEKLDTIQTDIKDIKTDITIIMAKDS